MYSVNNANNITAVGQLTSLYTRDLIYPVLNLKRDLTFQLYNVLSQTFISFRVNLDGMLVWKL